jgi:hypothetical protein
VTNLVLALITGFSLGVIAGAVAAVRIYVWRTSDPEVARQMLKTLYRQAHPHWLQKSETDTARVCPCCGWSETEGLASKAGQRE